MTSARPSGLRQPDAASVEPDVSTVPSLQAVLKLVLQNPTNLCYLHSTIYAIHWTMLQVRLHNARTSLPPQVFIMLCPPCAGAAFSSGPIQVLSLLPWLCMLRAWRDVHRQHDVAEFAMCLLHQWECMGVGRRATTHLQEL